jgi:hypothetical protein
MFRVQHKSCSTCIYRKDTYFDLKALEDEIRDPHLKGFFVGWRRCHHSDSACCRGFWNRHKNDFQVGQLAQRLQLVEYVDDDV